LTVFERSGFPIIENWVRHLNSSDAQFAHFMRQHQAFDVLAAGSENNAATAP
jgi:hypothetical protein